MLLRNFYLIFILFSYLHSANAGNKQLAYEALSSGDFQTAFIEYSILAEENDPVGQFFLGTMYLFGEGVEVNESEAFKLLKKASENFEVNANYYLDSEDLKAMRSTYFWLGILYNDGAGTKKDINKGAKLIERAADYGHIDAASRTALNYFVGHGIEKNMSKYVQYLYISTKGGKVDDYHRLAKANLNGTGTEINYEEAFKWFKKSAEHDYNNNYLIPKSYISLALMYNFGIGIQQDFDLAFKWFKLSAERGNKDAFVDLAYAYGAGEGTKKNMKLSFKWYKKAADEKIHEAYYPLAYLYANGEGTKKDEKKADELIFMLAELGDEAAKRIIEDAIKQANYENNIKDKEKLSICNAEFDTFDPKEHDCITSLENLHASYVSYYRDLKGGNIEKNHCSKFSAKNDSPKRIEYCFELLKGNIELNLELQRKKEIIRAYYDELEAQRRAEVRQQSINNLINIGISLLGGGSSSYHSNPYVPSTNSFEDKRMQCTRTHDTFFTCRPHMSLGERTNCVIGNRTCQNGMSFGYNGNNLFIGGQSGSKNACRNAPNGTFMCN